MTNRRWQDWGNVILGVWLFISPWVVGYFGVSLAASWNAWILGVAIVVFAALALSLPKMWEEGINILLGIWMLISPWVLGFTGIRGAESNAVIVGILTIVLAAWAMVIARHPLEHQGRIAQ